MTILKNVCHILNKYLSHPDQVDSVLYYQTVTHDIIFYLNNRNPDNKILLEMLGGFAVSSMKN